MKTKTCKFCTEETQTTNETETICYCNQITRQEIEQTIKETGLTTIPEIKKHLRDEVISNCAELNPTGKCCHIHFQAVINQVLEKL